MAAFIPSPPVNSVNCPMCDYNNFTGVKYCEGTVTVTVKDKNEKDVTETQTCGKKIAVFL